MELYETNGRLLGRDQILALVGRLQREKVHVPEMGGDVLIQEMTAAERDEYEASVIRGRGKDLDVVMRGLRAKLVIRCIIAEDGSRIFTEADLDAVNGIGARAIDRIFAAAQKLNGLTKEDVEELAGKSASGPSDGSLSDSP